MEYKINKNQHNFENYSKQNILHISAPKNEIGNLTARKICKLGQCYQRGGTSSSGRRCPKIKFTTWFWKFMRGEKLDCMFSANVWGAPHRIS